MERYRYTPYGQAEVLTASFSPDPDGKSDSDNDITFTGQRFDAESGLMLYRHRFYHTGLGTFCSRDPLGYDGSEWNLYEYVGGRPVTLIDPSGKLAIAIPIVCGGAAAFSAAEAIAAGFGLTVVACLSHPPCAQAIRDAVDDLVDRCKELCRRVRGCRPCPTPPPPVTILPTIMDVALKGPAA